MRSGERPDVPLLTVVATLDELVAEPRMVGGRELHHIPHERLKAQAVLTLKREGGQQAAIDALRGPCAPTPRTARPTTPTR